MLHHQPEVRTMIDAFGACKSIGEWAAVIGIDVRILKQRLRIMPAETALMMRRYARVNPLAQAGEPRAWNWAALRYEDDPWAQDFVARHPGGATLEEVGDVLGMTRERVRQVEFRALRKLRWCSKNGRLRRALEASIEMETQRCRTA